MKNRLFKNWIIYPKFQFSLIFFSSLIMLGTFVFIGFQVESSFSHMMKLGTDLNLDPNHAYFEFLQMQKTHLINKLIYAGIAAFILSLLLTIYISHRASGPIVRLKSYFREIKESQKIYPLKFRQGDYFDDLPEVVNEALKNMKQ